MAIDLAKVEAALAFFLAPDEAHDWAVAVVEDMDAIGLELEVGLLSHQPLRQPLAGWCYHIKDTAFGPEKREEPVADTHKAGGFGLDLGSIHQLAKVCQIGRRLMSGRWPRCFKTDLLNPEEHLPTVEEIWWLGLWYEISHVEPNQRVFEGNKHDVDWQFRCGGSDGGTPVTTINLEVKLRSKDWKRHVDGPLYSTFHASNFETLAKKFSRKNPGQLNVVGMTIFGPVDVGVRQAAEKFLAETPTLDAIILWTMGGGHNEQWDYIAASSETRKILRVFFHHGDEFDRRSRGMFVVHLWQDREARVGARLLGKDFDPTTDLAGVDGYSTHAAKITPVQF